MFKTLDKIRPALSRKDAQFISEVRRAIEDIKQQADGARIAGELSWLQDRWKELDCANNPARARKLITHAFGIVGAVLSRVLGIQVYDSQIIAARELAAGHLIEMGTGEGKTFVAPFAAYLYLVKGFAQVHVHTANAFLAERDARQLAPVYQALGMTTSVVLPGQNFEMRQTCYSYQVVYGAYGEFIVDFLRDSTARARGKLLQWQGIHKTAAIVDEADSALIDDARMPAVLYATIPGDAPSIARKIADRIVPHFTLCESERQKGLALSGIEALASEGQSARARGALKHDIEQAGFAQSGDFYLDGVSQVAVLTERGYSSAEHLFVQEGLLEADRTDYTDAHQGLLRMLTWALAAKHLFHRGVHYEVLSEEALPPALVPIDLLTGRLNRGRGWIVALTQALEAKEGLAISSNRVPLAASSMQSFFKEYGALAGMSGTLADDAEEFGSVYGLRVVIVAPNLPSQRCDLPDQLFRTADQKLEAVLREIHEAVGNQRPVLVGVSSSQAADDLAQHLSSRMGIVAQVLSAKHHEQEGKIIARAGRPGTITIATLMAGRGVDIVLGGRYEDWLRDAQESMGEFKWSALTAEEQRQVANGAREQADDGRQKVLQAGGLLVIGMGRFETQRMDAQLRGRAGRQGDPGTTVFYISMEDELIKAYASDYVRKVMRTLDLKDGDELEGALVKKAITIAQKNAQAHNAKLRSEVTLADSVLAELRASFLAVRAVFLVDDPEPALRKLLAYHVEQLLERANITRETLEDEWDEDYLVRECGKLGAVLAIPDEDATGSTAQHFELVRVAVSTALLEAYELQGKAAPDQEHASAARVWVVLSELDRAWVSATEEIEEVRAGMNLRAHVGEKPLVALRNEAGRIATEIVGELGLWAAAQALFAWDFVDDLGVAVPNEPGVSEVNAEEALA